MRSDTLIPDSTLEIIKTRLPDWNALEGVRWTGERRFVATCPFCGRREKFQGDLKANGHWLGKCWHAGCTASGEAGDTFLGLYQKLHGLSFRQAVDGVTAELGIAQESRPETAQERVARRREMEKRARLAEASEAAEKAQKRKAWPRFEESDIQCRKLAELRGIPLEGVLSAQRSGTLRFTRWHGRQCWVLRSHDGTAAEARKMDGKPFSLPDGRTEKALCLPGSDKKSFLVGSDLLGPNPNPCLLVEGGPDWLAACWLAWSGRHFPDAPQWIPLGLLGAGCLIPQSQLQKLRGRFVRIFAHGDDSGEGAAEKWTNQLLSVGCSAEVLRIGGLGLLQMDGKPANDLNDVVRGASDAVEAFTREVLR